MQSSQRLLFTLTGPHRSPSPLSQQDPFLRASVALPLPPRDFGPGYYPEQEPARDRGPGYPGYH